MKSDNYYNDHVNYTARSVFLKRWHQQITAVESTGDAIDARGDESLYKPSELGIATSSISEVLAGNNVSFELVYQCGKTQINAGTRVKFWMAGQGSLGSTPQLDYPNQPGFIEIFSNVSAKLKPFCASARVISLKDGENPRREPTTDDLIVGPISFGFEIVNGTLTEGDQIRIALGRKNGFIWKKLAGKKEFKVIIEPTNGGPKVRLPEPVVIHIKPLKPDHLDVFIPPTCQNGQKIEALISIRDKYDNRTMLNNTVSVKYADKKEIINLNNGIGKAKVGKMGKSPVRIEVKSEGLNDEYSNWCIPQSDLNLFFGDMHTHDSNSTAEGYTPDVYTWARDEKRLDFVSVPIQVHRLIDNEKWFLAKYMNEYFLDEGSFITFLSFEWQHSHYGDKVVHYLGGDAPYLPVYDERYNTPKKLYNALRQTDAFIISHHPGYKLDLHVPGTDWDEVENDVERLIEIWSMHGSSEGYNINDRPLVPPFRKEGVMHALKNGLKIGFVGGSDTHTARPGGSVDEPRPYYGGLCGVWAEKLTRRSLFEAFKSRRTYALTGSRIILKFTVNNSPMGSEIALTNKRTLKAKIWALEDIAQIEFIKNGDLLYKATPKENTCVIDFEDNDNSNLPCFYYCRVVQDDGQLAVCSPVWMG